MITSLYHLTNIYNCRVAFNINSLFHKNIKDESKEQYVSRKSNMTADPTRTVK